MSQRQGRDAARSTVVSTTTTHGPTITTTTFTGGGSSTTVTSAPHATTISSPTVTTTHQARLSQPPRSSGASDERQPSIRIRHSRGEHHAHGGEEESHGNRGRRSFSEPERPQPALLKEIDDLEIRRHASATALQTLHEEGSGYSVPQFGYNTPAENPRRPEFNRQVSAISLRHARNLPAGEYEADVVDVLDVIDPEVSTLTTLNNVQNSLFLPNFGRFYQRRPTYSLSQSAPLPDEESAPAVSLPYDEENTHTIGRSAEKAAQDSTGHLRPPESANRLTRTNTISSVLTGVSEGHNYAVLPHGASLPGWTAEEKALLNDRVRHLLHSRRAKFLRGMRGFGRYVRKPVGFLVTLYAFLLTFWGAAWVLFLIGWIGVGGRQKYWIEICDQILTALFCVVGIGMAPWRAIDTYHMIYVAKYAHKTWRVRKERGLPKLRDRNELPTLRAEGEQDTEREPEEPVLKVEEQQKLEYHQSKLAASHTFYKPHETTTHHAFSVRLLIAIVVLLDCHSLFQMALGGTTWGIYYKVRPKALTAVILSCSISCNISAGVTISVGDRRSRKKLVVEQMFRQGLTEEALGALRKERGLVAEGIEKGKSPRKAG